MIGHKNTAAALLGAALQQLYPDALLLGGGSSGSGFFYEIDSPRPLDLARIEETMRLIAASPLSSVVTCREMVPVSAAGYLARSPSTAPLMRHRAEAALSAEGLLSIVEIGSYSDWMPGPFLETLKELFPFQLVHVAGNQRVEGVVAPDKKQLKERVEALRLFREEGPRQAALEMGLYQERGAEGKRVWRARGLAWIARWTRLFAAPDSQEVKAEEWEELSSSPETPAIHQIDPHPWRLFQKQRCQTEGELVSSLQFLRERFKLLGFRIDLVITGRKGGLSPLAVAAPRALPGCPFEAVSDPDDPRLEWWGENGVGERRRLAVQRLLLQEGGRELDSEIEIEENCALLLEKSVVNWPAELILEHVRFLPVKVEHETAANGWAQECAAAGFSASVDTAYSESLGARVRRACQERALSLAVIGDREEEAGGATWRCLDQPAGLMSREALKHKIKALLENQQRNSG